MFVLPVVTVTHTTLYAFATDIARSCKTTVCMRLRVNVYGPVTVDKDVY